MSGVRNAPATAAGPSSRRAELGIALVSPVMRAIVLVQILLSVASGSQLATHPGPYILFSLLVAAVSILMIAQCLLTGSVLRGWWHLPDIAVAWAAVPVMSLLMPPTHVVGTWEAWAAGLAINVAALGATWLKPGVAVAHGVALGTWYLAWVVKVGPSWETMVNNALTIPAYALVVALLVAYLRALAADADRSREEAVEASRALELERYRLTVHDASSILRLLSDEDTPAEVLPGLRAQGHREATRLRNYLSADASPARLGRRTVGTMLDESLEGFDDLPLELAVDLGRHARLSPDVWTAASRAVTTVLHNVRLHADAHQVIVHADSDDVTWEVVVADDGVGFDQASQPLGFGLDTQAGQALRDVGVTATIRSAPGRGTSVTLVGPVEWEGLDA